MIKFSPRYFVLPLFAIVVIGALPEPADSARAARAGACNIGSVGDPGLRAAFANFDRSQSAAAAKICALYRNSTP